MIEKKDQPGYGKPGKQSWKIEGLRSRRNTRRLARVASSMDQKRAHNDRALALGEYLSPKARAQLMKLWRSEKSQRPEFRGTKGEPPRAQRRRELRAYARKVDVHPRLVWQTYQDEKQKGLTTRA